MTTTKTMRAVGLVFRPRLGGEKLAMKVEVTAERVARNQATFREANEQIEGSAEDLGRLAGDRLPFICECPEGQCTSVALLSFVDYEMIRSRGDWFFAVPGHETCVVDGEEVAKLVDRNETFSLMEKVGRAGELAEQLDPRG